MARKAISADDARAVRLQYGALPYRMSKEGQLEILLVTSRDTGRWIIPKGWPMKGRKPPKAAAREAFEEAGVRGSISSKAVGSYRYDKRLDGEDGVVPCEVKVFPLLVKRQLKKWPEMKERQTRWFTPMEAASFIEEEGLRDLVVSFAAETVPASPAMEVAAT